MKWQRHVQLILWKQEIPWLFDVVRGKKAEDSKHVFFKALANRFWFTSKSCSWLTLLKYNTNSLLHLRTMNGAISWYVLALQRLFHFIACVSFFYLFLFFLFFVDSTTFWVFQYLKQGIEVAKWSFDGWIASALFSN